MLRRALWSFCLFALLAPAVAARQDAKPSDAKPAEAPKLEEVAKNLASLQKQAEETAQLLKKMTEQLDKLTDVSLQTQANAADLKKLRERLEKLEVDVVRLESAAEKARRSFAAEPPPSSGSAAGRGTLRLENAYSLPMSVLVDGVTYTLQPGEIRNVERTAGSFTYEVPGVQANVLRSLTAGETFTIRIYPR